MSKEKKEKNDTEKRTEDKSDVKTEGKDPVTADAVKGRESGREDTGRETSGKDNDAGEKKDGGGKEDTSGKSEEKDAGSPKDNAGDSENKGGAGSSEEGFFSRNKKDKKDEKIDELTDRLTRQLAEFDNYRKRTEKEKASMYDMGAADVITKILDVADNFERGLSGADESDPFVLGMMKTYKQLTKVLSDLGVTEIEAEGKPFDPSLHNAVMHEDNPDVGENVVTQVLQKGYKYKDTVIRHSMVKVAN